LPTCLKAAKIWLSPGPGTQSSKELGFVLIFAMFLVDIVIYCVLFFKLSELCSGSPGGYPLGSQWEVGRQF
jgi:hypothetical protein